MIQLFEQEFLLLKIITLNKNFNIKAYAISYILITSRDMAFAVSL